MCFDAWVGAEDVSCQIVRGRERWDRERRRGKSGHETKEWGGPGMRAREITKEMLITGRPL